MKQSHNTNLDNKQIATAKKPRNDDAIESVIANKSVIANAVKQSHDATGNNQQIASSLAMTHAKVPKLRFKEFEGEWEARTLKDITKINQGLQIAISERFTECFEGTYFYITNEFLRAGSTKKYFIKNPPESVLCTEDDILMTRTGNTGQVVTGVNGAFHNNFFKIKFDTNCDK